MNKQNDTVQNKAFIDGQNLHLGASKDDWKVDFNKFRTYLKDNFNVTEAYYWLGYITEKEQSLYNNLQKAGFLVQFKEHSGLQISGKKGNVDTDIVFDIMKKLNENEIEGKVILVSGDGDYKKLVEYLIEKNKFLKIIFPNKKFASSLYKSLTHTYFMNLEDVEKIKLKKSE